MSQFKYRLNRTCIENPVNKDSAYKFKNIFQFDNKRKIAKFKMDYKSEPGNKLAKTNKSLQVRSDDSGLFVETRNVLICDNKCRIVSGKFKW